MQGTIAITDTAWYERLRTRPELEEVNFWKPSATRTFLAEPFSPFLFKLRAPESAICGFAFFVRYSRLPDWLAWETFGIGNGCDSLEEMRSRISGIRDRIHYRGNAPADVGCILLVQPTFLPPEAWVRPPRDWPARTQADKKYDLASGEGARVWSECCAMAGERGARTLKPLTGREMPEHRYGKPALVTPRLGQGTFRIAVMEAYGRGCAVTAEHSLPALEAAHIRPYADAGNHEVRNGVLLRADIHRLLDKGYVTVTPDLKFHVSRRLRDDYENGRTYYPLEGRVLRTPASTAERPASDYLRWHNENRFLG